jgi:hypothetical protein
LGGGRSGEISLNRFFHNDAVTVEEIFATAGAHVADRCSGCDHVLVLQDTTVVRGNKQGGLFLHVGVAMDAQSDALLGVVHGEFVERVAGRNINKRHVTTADKESQRWLTVAAKAGELCSGAQRITVIADRESDIFEALVRRPANVHLLIRAARDRALEDGTRVFAQLDAQPELARRILDLPAGGGRKARQAELALRLAHVRVRKPRNGKQAKDLPQVMDINLVDVREVNVPAGQTPLHWRLLCTQEVTTIDQGWDVAALYRRRWHIEQVFRSYKSEGFDIEKLRLQDEAPLEKVAAACFVATVIAQQLVHARDGAPPGKLQRPMLDAFQPDDIPLIEAFCKDLEGKTERQKNPHPRGSLAYAAWVCARLGGWTGYYGKPGPIVMLRGWRHLNAAKLGWTLASHIPEVGNV